MAGREEIIAELARIGEQGVPDAVMERCTALCRQHGLGARELANQWEAHAVNSSCVSMTPAALDGLAAMLSKAATKKTTNSIVTPRPPERTPLHNKDNISKLMSPPLAGHKRAAPFASPLNNRGGAAAKTEPMEMSPTSVQSPPDALPTYNERNNAGQTVVLFNKELPAFSGMAPPPSTAASGARVTVSNQTDVGVMARYRHMYTPLEERSRALERTVLFMQAEMEERAELSGVTAAGAPSQELVTVVGRVRCEAESGAGRINKASVELEGSWRDSDGQRVHCDLKHLPSYSLFPGQTIAAQGMNPTGANLVVSRLLEGVRRPRDATAPDELLRLQHGYVAGGGAPYSVLVAAGPYTTVDNLKYTPFADLLAVVATTRPDVVVLLGPFVDEAHPQVAAGTVSLEVDGMQEAVDFETLFKVRIAGPLDALLKEAPDLATQFVLVPSTRDAFHDFVYPQPPLADRVPGGVPLVDDSEDRVLNLELPRTSGLRKRVHCVGEPAMFKINEVVVGATSTDVLFDLSCDDVSHNVGHRLARLTEHLLLQQSFYPLYPPPAPPAAVAAGSAAAANGNGDNANSSGSGGGGGSVPLDLRHAAKWRMPVTPDVLLLPSRLAQFARDQDGCLCVNPGRLAKGGGGGTFAHLLVHPMPKDVLEAAAAASAAASAADSADLATAAAEEGTVTAAPAGAPLPHDVPARTRVEVKRI